MKRALMMLGAVGASALFFVLVWGLLHALAWGAGATGDGITEFTSGVVATMALALAGLGVWFQVDEVRQQREELRGSREAQERLAASQERANELAANANELAQAQQLLQLEALAADCINLRAAVLQLEPLAAEAYLGRPKDPFHELFGTPHGYEQAQAIVGTSTMLEAYGERIGRMLNDAGITGHALVPSEPETPQSPATPPR